MPTSRTETAFRPATAADAIGARLRTRLLDGAFAPGEAVSIRKVSESEGISVIPARDALRGLVAEGALAFRDARTIIVPAPDAAMLGELRYARVAIEGELAARAFEALRAKADELAEIDSAVTDALLTRDVSAYMRTNRALHFAIYDAADAPVLHALAERLWLRFAPLMRIVCESFDGQPPRADHHVAAIAALRRGDGIGFRRAVEADIAQGMDTLLTHVSHSDPSRGDP